MSDHGFNELGRKLLAAVASNQFGTGVDYVLKKTPEAADPWWAELGEKLAIGMAEKIASKEGRSDREIFGKLVHF